MSPGAWRVQVPGLGGTTSRCPRAEAASCAQIIWQGDKPEQPKAIQSPELLMATDSIL